MAHYDFMYDSFTLENVEEEITKLNKLKERTNSERGDLILDLDVVKGEHTKIVLNTELNELINRYKSFKNEILGWLAVKENILNGKKFKEIK